MYYPNPNDQLEFVICNFVIGIGIGGCLVSKYLWLPDLYYELKFVICDCNFPLVAYCPNPCGYLMIVTCDLLLSFLFDCVLSQFLCLPDDYEL